MKPAVISAIVDQHAEEAAFLWILRDAAVRAPHYRLKDLANLDGRVEAHIDGLRIAGEDGWRLCQQGLQSGEAGEVFAAAVLAFEEQQGERIDTLVTAGRQSDETFRGLVSALGWIPYAGLHEVLLRLLTANSPIYRRLGISACAIQRKDPGDALISALKDPDSKLKVRALRAAGELGRRDLAREVQENIKAEDEEIRFWAAWSCVLIGERSAVSVLTGFAKSDTPFRERAMQIALRVMDNQSVQAFLKGIAGDSALHRYVLMGAGIAGDPFYVSSLIKKMAVPELARTAGEAFSMITGLDLAYDDLEGERPEDFAAGPSENPEDEEVAMDADEDLPWPDQKLVQAWWEKNKNRFKPGTRYLCGRPISIEQCQHVLKAGYQRQRLAAALELTIRQPEQPLYNTSAPGFRQQKDLNSGMIR